MTQIGRSTFALEGADERSLLWHMALYGLAAILDEVGLPGLRVTWLRAAQATPRISADSLTTEVVADAVLRHAQRHVEDSSWLRRDFPLKGSRRGLMSPRVTAIKDDLKTWEALQAARHDVLDRLLADDELLTMRFVHALGEPAYWSKNRRGEYLQDDGASRLEMQPRNQGSEIVRNRLRPLAEAVAGRTPEQVLAGLAGASRIDEVGNDSVSSRTATGFAAPGPTDNAVAWCALWGISCFPVASRVDVGRGRKAVTAAHFGVRSDEWFFVPMWHTPWTVARLRTVIASRALATVGASSIAQVQQRQGGPVSVREDGSNAGSQDRGISRASEGIAERAWLRDRGVYGVVRFSVGRFGSDSAPERRALRGEAVSAP